VLTQQVEPENRNERLDAAATPPAETSIVSGANLVSGKRTCCAHLYIGPFIVLRTLTFASFVLGIHLATQKFGDSR
jgi:hypothetical protein